VQLLLVLDGDPRSIPDPQAGTGVPQPRRSQLLLLLLGLGGSVELGSLDQVMDVSAYKCFNRCPALVRSKSKEKGKKNTCFELLVSSAPVLPSSPLRGRLLEASGRETSAATRALRTSNGYFII
jgi:hypothetical protein